MEELRQEFLVEAISKLENLQTKLETETLSEETEREIFRRLHTLKGTSQTFNLDISGKLAHEIENLLHAKRDSKLSANINFQELLREGIGLLLETFQNIKRRKEAIYPVDYIEKIHNSITDYSESISANETLSAVVPPNLSDQLSAQERNALTSALARGKFFYLIEVGFDFVGFDEKFKELRQILLENGEIIANFPTAKFTDENKIGFQIFYVSRKVENDIVKTIQPFGATLNIKNAQRKFPGGLEGVLEQAVAAGENTARKLSKQIEFETSSDEIELSAKQLNVISEALLHLVRNAADHGIETNGKIKIEISNHENSIRLRVTDDGRGIDARKIRAKAIGENLISGDAELSKDKLMQMIFVHGFSTSERVSEISGRGVGLDSVAEAVAEAGGEIRVESEPSKGTTFVVRLPK